MIRESTSDKEMAEAIARRFERDGMRAAVECRTDGYYDVLGWRTRK